METKEIYYYYYYAPREMQQEENLNELRGLFQAYRCYQREEGRNAADEDVFLPSVLYFSLNIVVYQYNAHV